MSEQELLRLTGAMTAALIVGGAVAMLAGHPNLGRFFIFWGVGFAALRLVHWMRRKR